MNQNTTHTEVFHAAAEFLRRGDIDGYLELCANDVHFEFPFAADPVPRIIEGKEALSAHLRRRAGLLKAPRIISQELYVTDRPGTIVSEITLEGAEGTTRQAIAVTTIVNGLIVAYRDYFNPLEVTSPAPHGPEVR